MTPPKTIEEANWNISVTAKRLYVAKKIAKNDPNDKNVTIHMNAREAFVRAKTDKVLLLG